MVSYKGLRRGDLLSTYLFILGIEMVRMIRRESEASKGLGFARVEFRSTSLYMQMISCFSPQLTRSFFNDCAVSGQAVNE